jgi:hypothetical protein
MRFLPLSFHSRRGFAMRVRLRCVVLSQLSGMAAFDVTKALSTREKTKMELCSAARDGDAREWLYEQQERRSTFTRVGVQGGTPTQLVHAL